MDDCTNNNGAPNPLLVHTVIKEISNYLTPSDLKSYRFVCKQWNEELSKVLKKVTRLSLLSEKRLEEFLNASITNPGFCSTVHLKLPLKLQEENSLSKKLFEIHGAFIKSLYLDDSKWSRNDLTSILYDNCPNLEELSLIGSGVEEGLFPCNEDDEEPLPVPTAVGNIKCLRVNLICTRMIRNTKLMADLLKITPNVETISWIEIYLDEIRYDRNFQLDLERAWCAKPHENGITIRDTICDTAIHHKNIRLSKLSRIESNMRLSNESIQVLQGRQFPLKFLDISLTIDVEPTVLSALLTTLSNTLITLRLEFYPSEVGHSSINFFDFTFPRMSKLQHLFVQKFSRNFSLYRNFNSANFPSLKSLTLCETDFKGIVETESGFCKENYVLKNENLRILQVTCDLSRYSLSNEGVSNLASFFPNLKDARIENFDRVDRSFWQSCFQKLENLGPPSDRGLGGLPSPKTENECSKCCKHFVKVLYQRH